MTAVANPPSFANINRPAWGSGSQSLNGSSNHDDVRSMFAPRKSMQRTNSSSSIASNASTSSTVTVVSANGAPSTNGNGNGSINGGPVGGAAGIGSLSNGGGTSAGGNDANGPPITTLRKRQQQKPQWAYNKQSEHQADILRGAGGAAAGRQQMGGAGGPNGVSSLHQLPPFVSGGQSAVGANTNGTNGIMNRQQGGAEGAPQQAQPVLYLVSLNGTFERKTISVPFLPDTLRIGRQTNKSTTPNTVNGFFDSKVLSRQHAEIYADRQGTIWIRDIKSSNGTFVNGTRLSAENRESEPHELQTNDHLELGIDIVSEDQKSVVHHKVAAKVEHAGFIKTSNNLLDMNFGDLDPANGAMLGNQLNGMPFRGRTGSQASLGPAGRMAPTTNNMGAAPNNGLALQRGLWLTGPSTEAIVKKIHQEMRNAKQQSHDLLRTQEFIQALLSKDDIRNDTKAEAAAGADQLAGVPRQQQPLQQIPNGQNSISFRADAKTRFSDPPAPPPQQPLPEKPDVPSLKRGSTERPKSGSLGGPGPAPGPVPASATGGPNNTSPVRPDVMGQVLQLTDALNTAKREIVTQHTRLRELEEKLHREQEARKYAEELTQQLELFSSATKPPTNVDAAAVASIMAPMMNGAAKGAGATANTVLEAAFEPSKEEAKSADDKEIEADTADDAAEDDADDADSKTDAAFRARIDSMMTEMEGMKRQLQAFQERAEKAEAERDADRETLAQMIQRIRERDEADAKAAAEAAKADVTTAATGPLKTSADSAGKIADDATSRSVSIDDNSDSTKATSVSATGRDAGNNGANSNSSGVVSRYKKQQQTSQTDSKEHIGEDDGPESAALSRTNTITPASALGSNKMATKGGATAHDPVVLHSIPYASMVGVVLIGMGLMAYLNGWQPSPGRLDR